MKSERQSRSRFGCFIGKVRDLEFILLIYVIKKPLVNNDQNLEKIWLKFNFNMTKFTSVWRIGFMGMYLRKWILLLHMYSRNAYVHMYLPIYQNLYMNVHHQIIHDSQKVELTQMWIN